MRAGDSRSARRLLFEAQLPAQGTAGLFMTANDNPTSTRLALAERLIHAGRALLASAGQGVRFRNFAEAERCFKRAVEVLWEAGDAGHPQRALAWERLATLYDRLGNVERAETCYLRSLAAQQISGWPSVVCDERTMVRLARLYGRMGKENLQLAVLSKIETRRPCSCRRHGQERARAPALSGEERQT